MPTMSQKNKKVVKDIPSSTQWLLEFVNLGKEPGELSTPAPFIDRLKRKPERSEVDISNLRFYPLRGKGPFRAVDQSGNMWVKKTRDAVPEWGGKREELPEKELWELVSRRGLPGLTRAIFFHEEDEIATLKKFEAEVKSVSIIWLDRLWHEMRYTLYLIMGGKGADDFFEEYFNPEEDEPRGPRILTREGGRRLEFEADPYNLFKGILAYFGDFYVNKHELHSRLKLCPCCGRFWIAEKSIGRPRIFCGSKCEDLFNQLPKDKKREVMAARREEARRKRKGKERGEITKLLQEKFKYSEKEAIKEAKNWIDKQGKTLNQFKRDF